MRYFAIAAATGLLLTAGCSDNDGGEGGATLAPAAEVEGLATKLFSVYGLGGSGRGSCRDARYREFDFWLGDWSIVAFGGPAGGSRITADLSGCAVLELYQGGSGRSLSRYDQRTGLWHQDYVDPTGFTLRLFGGLVGGEMQMQDSVRAIPNGPALLSKFTWTPNADGTVRQLWDFSFDGGANFIVNFDGLYNRDSAYVPPSPPLASVCLTGSALRAADGFLGTWRVATTAGATLGTSTLALSTGDCLIEETFRGRNGYALRSFLYYDQYIGTWYRAQVDNRADGFRLGGQFQGATLGLTGAIAAGGGRTIPIRVRWTPESGDTLTQRWEMQNPAGVWVGVTTLRWTRLS